MSLSILATNVPNDEGYPYTAENPYIVDNLDWTKYEKDNLLSAHTNYKDLAALILGATKPKDLAYLVVKVVSTKSYAWQDSATGVHSGITLEAYLTRTLSTVEITLFTPFHTVLVTDLMLFQTEVTTVWIAFNTGESAA